MKNKCGGVSSQNVPDPFALGNKGVRKLSYQKKKKKKKGKEKQS